MQTGLWTVLSALEEDPQGRGRHGLYVDKYEADRIKLGVNPLIGVEDAGYHRYIGSTLHPILGTTPEFDFDAARVETDSCGVTCLTDGKNLYFFRNQPAEQLKEALCLIKQRVGERLANERPCARTKLEAPSRYPT